MQTRRVGDDNGRESNARRPGAPAYHHPPTQRRELPYPGALSRGAAADPSSLSRGDVLQLQRTIGNQAVNALLRRQPQLTAAGQARDSIRRKEVAVTIISATRPRKMGKDRDSLIHGQAGAKLEKGAKATIYDDKTFRSRLKTDHREQDYRKNPVDALWYRLKTDEADELYLRSGTFEPIGSNDASDVLTGRMDELTDWLPLPTYNGLLQGVEQQKMLRPHGLWLFEALKVVHKNGARGGDMRTAALALFRYVQRARNAPGAGEAFESEALQASGWAEKKALKETPAIRDIDLLLGVKELYNQPRTKPTDRDDEPLDKVRMEQDLPPALVKVLKAHDPAEFESVHQPLDRTISRKANLVQKVAGGFFAHAPKSSATLKLIHGSWQYSKNIVDLQTQDVSGSRMALLRSRAQMSEVGVLDKVHFKSNRPSDLVALNEVLENMLRDRKVADLVDRHIRATPRREGSRVYMQTLLQKIGGGTDAQWNSQWQMIRSLCHELLHVMVHPDFSSAENKVENAQIVAEGFVEVLGVDLYNHMLAMARKDDEFRDQLIDRLAKPDIPTDVASKDLGYGDASQKALQIRDRVGKPRFEAAFFLGAPELVGIG